MRLPALLSAYVAAGLAFSSLIPAQAAEKLDGIVVVVNDEVILQSELDSALADTRNQIRARNIEVPDDSVLVNQVLERLVQQRVQTQKAKTAGIRVDDRELNEVLANIAKQNNMTVGQLAEEIKKSGLDYLAAREQIRSEVITARLRQKEVDSRVQVTEQDVDLYLANQAAGDEKQYQLSHILVAIPDGASSEVREQRRQKAEGLRKRLGNGEDFAQLAIASSDGQQALQGGDLGYKAASDMPSLFAGVAAKLKTGEVSPVLETSSGFHIIKLQGTRIGDEERKKVTETHSRHILVRANALRNEDATRQLADDISARIKKGEDFAKLSAEFSDDPGSKAGGGDLGWQAPGSFVPEFQIALDSLKPGDTSAPFHTQFGWHIAQVLDRRDRDVTDEVRRLQARQAISQRKSNEEFDSWLRRLRDEAYVEYRGGYGPKKDTAAS